MMFARANIQMIKKRAEKLLGCLHEVKNNKRLLRHLNRGESFLKTYQPTRSLKCHLVSILSINKLGPMMDASC
jgi:hypothetical protein